MTHNTYLLLVLINREIKFRLYDKDSKSIISYMDGWSSSIDVLSMLWKLISNSGSVIQQFTGIYDINKQEIYEGDIINYHYYKGLLCVVAVVWDADSAKFVLKSYDNKVYKNIELTSAGKYEVIGNIFQDQDLLK